VPFAVTFEPVYVKGTSCVLTAPWSYFERGLCLRSNYALLSLNDMAANTSVMPESLRTLFSADLKQVVGRRVIVASATILIAFVISSTLHRGAKS